MTKYSTLPYLSTDSRWTHSVPVALISLPDMVDRRQKLLEHGVPTEWVANFFKASDMRLESSASALSFVDRQVFRSHYGFDLSSAQVGCALSHRRVAEWLTRSPYRMCLVLEDDIIPRSKEYLTQISSIARAFDAHSRNGAKFIVHFGVEGHWHQRVIKRKVTGEFPSDLEIYLHTDTSTGLWYTHAYLLSRGAAKSIAQREKRLISNVDDWRYRRELGLIDEIFYTQPPIFSQNAELQSTIALCRQGVEPLKRLSLPQRAIQAIIGKRALRAFLNSLVFRWRRIYVRLQAFRQYRLPSGR